MKKRNLAIALAATCVLILGVIVYAAAISPHPKNIPAPMTLPEETEAASSPSPPFSLSPSASPSPSPSPTPSPSPSPPPAVFELPPLVPPPPSIFVPDNYSSIQQAVRYASEGDAILVRKGTYRVPVTVDKAVWLIGEDNESTIIDAHSVGPNLLITHDGVNVTGFTMINTPTPATGSWLEQMQGIGLPKQLPNIEIRAAENCNIYGNRLTNSSGGVSLEGSSKNNVIANEISYNSNGVRIWNSTGNNIANNFFKGGGTAIFFEFSANNAIVNNTVTDATAAIWLYSASGSVLRNNTLASNYHNFGVTGRELSAFVNDVDASNIIDGKPIYYWIGKANQTCLQTQRVSSW